MSGLTRDYHTHDYDFSLLSSFRKIKARYLEVEAFLDSALHVQCININD